MPSPALVRRCREKALRNHSPAYFLHPFLLPPSDFLLCSYESFAAVKSREPDQEFSRVASLSGAGVSVESKAKAFTSKLQKDSAAKGHSKSSGSPKPTRLRPLPGLQQQVP